MKTFFAIIRWMVALGIGLVMYVAVIIAVPISVFGEQMLNSTSGMRWVNEITSDTKGMESFTEGMFTAFGKANVDDADAAYIMQRIGDKSTPLGKSVRLVFPSTIISKIIQVNATSFYSWLDGKTELLKLTIYLGGTKKDQASLISNFSKVVQETLPACTAAQKAAMADDFTIGSECSTGMETTQDFDKYAEDLLADPKAAPYLQNGIPWDAEVTQSDRQTIISLRGATKHGLISAWVVLGLSAMFMLLFFTPRGVNFIATGLVVGFTGLTIVFMGGGAKAMSFGASSYATAAESIAKAFGETLGKPIAVQGMYILSCGLVLIAIGGLILFRRKGTKTVATTVYVTEPAKISEPVKAAEPAHIAVSTRVVETTPVASHEPEKVEDSIKAVDSSVKKN